MSRETVGDNTCINPTRLVLKLGAVYDECVAFTLVVQVALMFGLAFIEGPTSFSIINAATATTWNLVDIRVR